MAMESEEKKDQSILIAETLYQSRAAFRNNLEEFTTLQSTLQHYKSLPEFPHDFLEEHETSNQQAIADLTQRIQELDVMIENLRTNIFKAVKRKIPDQSETLVGSELVLTAASQIADPETREKILDLCKAFHKNIDLLINWFLEEISNPDIILNHWKQLTLGGRPIIKVPNSWEAQQTFICIEDLIKGLHNDWQGEPIIIHG